MSTRDRLSKLTADLSVPALGDASDSRTETPRESDPAAVETRFPPAARAETTPLETRFPAVLPRPPGQRTGPGDMLAFRGKLLEVEGESERLRAKLKEYEGSLPTRKLDTALVGPSRWANRHDASFSTAEFARFKADIEHAGGNVQPILVRRFADDESRYEIVFGHRRHRACLELGLPVLAAIATEPMPDVELFAAMDRENRERADLSAWEQGTMYARALEEQMFPSQRRLAEALGVSHTWVRKAIAVAELPEPIVQCFRSPIEIDHRHAEEINAALEHDRRAVLRRAERLRQGERMSSSSVVAALVGRHRGGSERPRDIKSKDAIVGRLTWDSRGQATIRLRPGVAHEKNVEALMKALEASLAE